MTGARGAALVAAALATFGVAGASTARRGVAPDSELRAVRAELSALRRELEASHRGCEATAALRSSAGAAAALAPARVPGAAAGAACPAVVAGTAESVLAGDRAARQAAATVSSEVEALFAEANSDGRWDDERRFRFHALLGETTDAERARLSAQAAQLVNAGVLTPVGDAAPH